MVIEAINWYVESLTALWVALASGGLLRLILIGCIIYWVMGGPMRWRGHCHCHHRRRRWRCPHCGCRCGRCPCGDDADDEDGSGDKSKGAKAK